MSLVSPPSVSVVIVTHNSAADLPKSLPAISRELGPGDDLVVVDSGSSDGTLSTAGRVAPDATRIDLGENLGFAAGCNRGAATSSADLLVFLNPDVTVEPGCLDALRTAGASKPDWGAWQALVTLPGGTAVNTSGGIAHYLGFGWAGQFGCPVDDVPRSLQDVAFASGAALVVRRVAWTAAGGFDPAYFMYCEDLDLSLRLRLMGYGIGVVPGARVEHAYEFHKGRRKWYLLERNRWQTVVRVFPAGLLMALLPALIATEVLLVPIAMAGGWLPAKLKSQVATLRALPHLLRERRRIQSTQRISTRRFAETLTADFSSPFLGAAATSTPVQRLLGSYWSVVRFALRASRTRND